MLLKAKSRTPRSQRVHEGCHNLTLFRGATILTFHRGRRNNQALLFVTLALSRTLLIHSNVHCRSSIPHARRALRRRGGTGCKRHELFLLTGGVGYCTSIQPLFLEHVGLYASEAEAKADIRAMTISRNAALLCTSPVRPSDAWLCSCSSHPMLLPC